MRTLPDGAREALTKTPALASATVEVQGTKPLGAGWGISMSLDRANAAYGLLEYFKLLRMQKGTAWCRKDLIGPLRRSAGVPLPQNALPLTANTEGEAWAKVLAGHCRECCGCKLAER